MTQGFSGVGLVTSHARTSGGGKGIGTFWGNCPKFELSPSPTAVERNSSMDVSRSPLRRLTSATALAVSIACDEFNKKNVARAVHGRVDEVAADAGTVINHVCPVGAALRDVLATPTNNVNTVVITDSTGAPKTLVKDVNYTEDLFSGHFTLIDITTGGPYVQPFKIAHKQGAVSVISGLAAPTPDLWIACAGTNVDNLERGHCDVYRVRLDPASVLQFINTEYQDFELKGTALVDTTKTAAGVGGNVFRWSLPATHE